MAPVYKNMHYIDNTLIGLYNCLLTDHYPNQNVSLNLNANRKAHGETASHDYTTRPLTITDHTHLNNQFANAY